MLEVRDLATGYGQAEVLHGVTIAVNAGEIVAVVGANGAGKSTLLKALSGLLPARRGSITFDGARIDGAAPEAIVRLGIAHIPEGRRVFPYSTIEENLSAGAYVRTDSAAVEADREAYYRRFPALRERRDRLASTLSGGEQQMLAISRGLMSRPKLILMDEPSLGLSPIMVDRVFEIIQELNKEGKAILLVEQNATRALAIAHRAYVLVTGEVALSGSGKDLLGNEEVQRSYLGS
ncbi:MAG: ABC transporter ATP-binding protein [Alphaproteobacteria bacterium]|nr:ABC transporter ATP-binding protein [Alphaproteobacteria bacterium]